jgi:membrane associated rhomboid family serine protease
MPCPWTTSADLTSKDNQCTLSELCGFGGVPNPKIGGSITETPAPNQWFRYIIPMFLHAGIIHIGFNLFAMLTIGSDMERVIGWWRFAIVYFASGIMGFVFGANFDSGGISTGSSGCLFGVLAVCLLDLLYKWKSKQRPVTELIVMIFTILISFVLGLLPGLDNFAHIGGFVTGLVLGICLLRSPDQLRERIGLASPPYTTMSGGLSPEDSPNGRKFVKQPLTFFGGRKPLWWVWWLIRAGALVGIIVAFIVLLNDFYKHRTNCSWCKYLSCLVSMDPLPPPYTSLARAMLLTAIQPVHDWCEMGEFKTTPVQSSPRALFM